MTPQKKEPRQLTDLEIAIKLEEIERDENSMKKEFDYITPIKDDLDFNMHRICILYMTIGMGITESPRWFNFGDFDWETGHLTIASTQRSALRFTISTDFEYQDIDVNLFWAQFKRYRTDFLENYYPTIERY